MANQAEIKLNISNKKTITHIGDSITQPIPGSAITDIEIHKDGYNPIYTAYSNPAISADVFIDDSLTLQLEPYQAVTLTVNSLTPDTTLTFYCDTGTVSGNTITVGKGTKVRYTLSKAGYNTLDRYIYINENTVENESLDEAVFKYTVNTSSTKTITIPFTTVSTMLTEWNNADAKLTIDWGDGTTTTNIGKNFTDAQITHTYTGNSYQISITSDKNVMPLFYNYRNTAQAQLITSIDTPFLKMCGDQATYLLYYCGNLTTVPANLLKYNSHIKNLSYAFGLMSYANNNAFTIPEKLLYYCTELENVDRIFQQQYSNRNKIVAVPEDLFYYSPKITTMQYAFYYCGYTSIPENLLSKLKYLTNVNYTFGYNQYITSIPENLFKYNINLLTANYTFYYCSNINLTSIPANLFKYNTKLEQVNYTFQYFRAITEIPATLFENNINLKSANYTFQNCINVSSIPTNLFNNNTKLTSVLGIFNLCPISNISVSEFIDILPASVTSIGLFRSWTKTTNEYATPEYVAKYYNRFNKFSYVFSGWLIDTIPSGIFDIYTGVTDLSYAFYYCTNITSIPADIFKYNTAVTTFAYAFYYCTKLTALPANLFTYNAAVTTFAYTFYYCSALTTLPADLFRYNLRVTSFYMTFYYCNKITLRSDIFGSDLTNRFKQQSSLTFYYCFYVYSWSGTRGTAPALWNCTFTDSSGYTITPTKSYCFSGHSSSSLSNYSSIPSAWRSSS